MNNQTDLVAFLRELTSLYTKDKNGEWQDPEPVAMEQAADAIEELIDRVNTLLHTPKKDPPVKLGGYVYLLRKNKSGFWHITGGPVTSIFYDERMNLCVNVKGRGTGTYLRDVFLTLEAARFEQTRRKCAWTS